ncbi:MAG: protein dehydratase, partial [Gemmobacter sp.]|nr:protein dehydratase [Gemmobacter sp.]
GEVLRRVSNIRDVTLKEGRSGALCFVTVDHAIYSGARPVIRERQDIVYRAAELPGTAKPPAPAPTPMGAFHRSVTPSAPLLFRYSALTFNGHRIHYDLAYARDVEGYPGLVVHGPMQAAMLVLYAQDLRGKRPARFSFRSLSPVFDTDDFTLNADEDAGALRLWVRRADGAVAMEARAEW